jgi:hypothetical protein
MPRKRNSVPKEFRVTDVNVPEELAVPASTAYRLLQSAEKSMKYEIANTLLYNSTVIWKSASTYVRKRTLANDILDSTTRQVKKANVDYHTCTVRMREREKETTCKRAWQSRIKRGSIPRVQYSTVIIQLYAQQTLQYNDALRWTMK